jgi:hypothetical protein
VAAAEWRQDSTTLAIAAETDTVCITYLGGREENGACPYDRQGHDFATNRWYAIPTRLRPLRGVRRACHCSLPTLPCCPT